VAPDAALHSVSGLTYLVEGDNYYIASEWTSDGVPVKTDYKVVHIPAHLKHKYVFSGGVGPNMVAIKGTFKFVGNVRGVNQFGGPVMIESYEVPDEVTRDSIDHAQQAQQAVNDAYNKKMKHNSRAASIDHYLQMTKSTDRANDPTNDTGLIGWINLLELYNEELPDSDTPGLIRSNIGVAETKIKGRLLQWEEFLQGGIAMYRSRIAQVEQAMSYQGDVLGYSAKIHNMGRDIEQAKKNLLGIQAQLAYLRSYKSDESLVTDRPGFAPRGKISLNFSRIYFKAGEKPPVTEIAPLAP
jgi:hypothetical protein